MGDARDIVVRALPGVTPEQTRDARARAWAFVFQCWQEKQKPAKPAPEPDGRNDGAIVRDTEGVSHVEQQADRSSEITWPAAL
jgi:hypothetical protein